MYKIPVTISIRLSSYYRCLFESELSNFIRSEEIAKRTGFSAAQVRRDLSYFGHFGIPGKGYLIKELKKEISKILGTDIQWKIALIGLGNLGSALLTYRGFKKHGFEIVAVFDNDRRKIGSSKYATKVYDISQLKKIVGERKIKMAIIATPVTATQEVVDRVVDSKIKAILNFTPIQPSVPHYVELLNIDMSIELERLSYLVTNRNKL
ncbi:redox-sensing transcriptional repressor Rex [Candidatus Latescibacterota bacterium]